MRSSLARCGRRHFLAAGAVGVALVAAGGFVGPSVAGPAIKVFKDPSCGCCGAWVEHMRQAGFAVTVEETSDLGSVKLNLGVPDDLASCHTAILENYVIEGHVPADAVRRLLAERPKARGLAVPGMPAGSPGMEGGTPEAYAVILFDGVGRRDFARYLGGQPV